MCLLLRVPAVASIPSPGPTSFPLGAMAGARCTFLNVKVLRRTLQLRRILRVLSFFSFPAVPGAQSAPSVPGFPSAAPLLSEAELSAIPGYVS